MKKIMIIFLVILLGCASFFSGCIEEEKEDEVEIGEGTLQLQITDKPGDLDILHANVTISSVMWWISIVSSGICRSGSINVSKLS